MFSNVDPALNPTQLRIQWAPGTIFPTGKNGRAVKLNTRIHVVPEARMIQLQLHSPYVFMPQCFINYLQEQLCFYLYIDQ
jgi:hypothetical protein